MTIAVWIVSGLLALLYLFAGISKSALPKDRLAKQFPWSEAVGVPATRLIGVAELLGAIGLIVPVLTGIAPVLAVVAAIGLALVQLAAIVFHLRRHESQTLPVNAVLLVLAVFVAVVRLLGY